MLEISSDLTFENINCYINHLDTPIDTTLLFFFFNKYYSTLQSIHKKGKTLT